MRARKNFHVSHDVPNAHESLARVAQRIAQIGDSSPDCIGFGTAAVAAFCRTGLCQDGGHRFDRELQVGDGDRKRIVDFVRHARSKHAAGSHALGNHQLLAHLRLLDARGGFAHLALDRSGQSREVALEDVVLRSCFQCGHGDRFADRPRDEDKRNVFARGLKVGKRRHSAVFRKRVVRNHDVPRSLLERSFEGFLRRHRSPDGVESPASQLADDELGVVSRIFDE